MRRSECSDCGQGFDVASEKGPLPARCQPCGTVYAKAMAKARNDRHRKTKRDINRVILCVDCDVVLEWDRKESAATSLRCLPDRARPSHCGDSLGSLASR